MKKVAASALLAVSVLALPVAAQVPASGDDLAGLQAAYQEESAKIEAKYASLLTNVSSEYGEALTLLEQSSTKKGDLDGVVAVRKEADRFRQQQTIPAEAVVKTPTELKALQQKFREQPTAVEAEKKKALAKAALAHVARLEKLKKSLTQAKKVDEALQVKAEIEKAKKTVDTAVSTPPQRRKPIPPAAVDFGGHHYLAVDGKLTWHQAKQACEEMGGHLVVIKDKRESDFVNSLVDGRNLWVGLCDGGKVGQWRWVDGSAPTFGNWFDGKPDNTPGNENFAHLKPGYGPTRWDDESVNAAMGFMCEWDY